MTVQILELDDIQSGVLRPRPTPFAATYIVLRIDDRSAGRELTRRLSKVVASAAHPESPARDTWISVALTFQGLKALGVPQVSLDSFSPQFHQIQSTLNLRSNAPGKHIGSYLESQLYGDRIVMFSPMRRNHSASRMA